jgi:hypothetical protein
MRDLIGKAMAALGPDNRAPRGARPAAAIAPQKQALAAHVVTPQRAELIRHALQVRAAKQTVFAELGDEDRARLVAMAVLALLDKGPGKE